MVFKALWSNSSIDSFHYPFCGKYGRRGVLGDLRINTNGGKTRVALLSSRSDFGLSSYVRFLYPRGDQTPSLKGWQSSLGWTPKIHLSSHQL
ncbi:hypothetical protein FRX31_032623 [Thalictrum thalictroides]|uniref:Uncharacterized protein n=1 Tax=Thalictrum thalictroides TaxID=46969 RepID=A0A7J6UYT9_THATH|nr:hypothetical protein FRX31_032623 [Thalictrum thalictroides]